MEFYLSLMRQAGIPADVMAQIERMRQGYGQFAEAVQPDATFPLRDGVSVRLGDDEWQVLHTPGHTGGLICLYQPQRGLLLSSDHLLRDVSSNPIVEPPQREGEPRPRRLLDYVTQLQRVAELPLRLALPGHGPFISDVPGLVAERLSFHEQRSQQVLTVLQEQPHTVYEVSLALFPSLDPINRFLAVSEIIGHLDLLQEQGQVSTEEREEGWLWRVA